MIKLEKKSENVTLREYYDALPYNRRDEFKEKIMTEMGWTDPQWRYRMYGKKQLTRPEAFMLHSIIMEDNKQ